MGKKKEPLDFSKVIYVCGFCANHDDKGVEWNFIDKAIYYKCSKCKKMNVLDLSNLHAEPYPSPIITRM